MQETIDVMMKFLEIFAVREKVDACDQNLIYREPLSVLNTEPCAA
jgi:hypothetical protein